MFTILLTYPCSLALNSAMVGLSTLFSILVGVIWKKTRLYQDNTLYEHIILTSRIGNKSIGNLIYGRRA